MKLLYTLLVLLLSNLTFNMSLFAQVDEEVVPDSVVQINPYDFTGYFRYNNTEYQYTVSPEKGNEASLVIRKKATSENSDAATFKEIYNSVIIIDDAISTKNLARVQIRYAQKSGYAWKPYANDFLQGMFFFKEGKNRYAPFGEKMIDRKKHSLVKKEDIQTSFDAESFGLADAVKRTVEFFIMKFPKLFSS